MQQETPAPGYASQGPSVHSAEAPWGAEGEQGANSHIIWEFL